MNISERNALKHRTHHILHLQIHCENLPIIPSSSHIQLNNPGESKDSNFASVSFEDGERLLLAYLLDPGGY